MSRMNLYELLNLKEYRKKYHIPHALLDDYKVGYDGKIYVLMSTDKDKYRKGRMSRNFQYHFFRITFDWDKNVVTEVERFDFGNWDKCVHHWCPFGENFLLVNARASTKSKEPNAYIVNKEGDILKSIFLGDGINHCYTTPDGKIINGYLDEGIFNENNEGAETGLSIWDGDGNCVCKNQKYDIWHCYGLTLDPRNHIWFQYYGHDKNNSNKHMFHLVCLREDGDWYFDQEFNGSRGCAISYDYTKIALGGGHGDHGSVYLYDMDTVNQTLSNKRKLGFKLNNKLVTGRRLYTLSEDVIFILMENGTLAIGKLK